MSDQAQPSAGEEQEVSSSGLLLSVEPLAGATNYKLSGDDGSDDSGGLSGGDTDSSDASDTDGSDAGGSGDADASDESESDADGTDAADADGTDTGADADGTDPLGIASDGADDGSSGAGIRGQRVKNGDDKDTKDT